MDDLSNRLKDAVVYNIMNPRRRVDLDAPYLANTRGSWTRRELAKEIEDETEIGIKQLEGMVLLTLDLLERGKEQPIK